MSRKFWWNYMIVGVCFMIVFLAGLVFHVQKVQPEAFIICENQAMDLKGVFGGNISLEKAGSREQISQQTGRDLYSFKSDGYTTSDGKIHIGRFCELHPGHRGYMREVKDKAERLIYLSFPVILALLAWSRRKDIKSYWQESKNEGD